MFFADLNTGWIVGDGGSILHTNDGGHTWTPQVSGTTSTLRDVYFLDTQRGFVTGPSTAILATTDGGATWTPRPFGAFGDIHDLTFVDDLNGWGVGQNGLIVRTTDGGLTWSQYPSPTTNTLFGVAFVSPDRGWAVGAYGTILFFGKSGAVATEQAPALPDGFALLPNYPNPFNPRTTIRFRLDRAGPVRLQVFDVLGRLVQALADGNYAAGEHAIDWAPQSNASGVYLYRLEYGGRSEVRKMTLLR